MYGYKKNPSNKGHFDGTTCLNFEERYSKVEWFWALSLSLLSYRTP